jgi:polyhydroxyalkanoate synthesis regulator phasin
VPLQRLIQEYVRRKELTGEQAAALLQGMMHQGLQHEDIKFLIEVHQKSADHDLREMIKDYCIRRKRILGMMIEDVKRVRRSINYNDVTKTDYYAIKRHHLPALFTRLDQANQNNQRSLNIAIAIRERFFPNTKERGIAEEFIRECNESIGIDNNNKAEIEAEIEKIIKKGYHDSRRQWIAYSVQKEQEFIRKLDEPLRYVLQFVREEENKLARWMRYYKEGVYST